MHWYTPAPCEGCRAEAIADLDAFADALKAMDARMQSRNLKQARSGDPNLGELLPRQVR